MSQQAFRYYRLNAKASKACEEAVKSRKAIERRCDKLAKSYGGKCAAYRRNGWSRDQEMIGVFFMLCEKPDANAWKQNKHNENVWEPKRTKAGKAVAAAMQEASGDYLDAVKESLGFTEPVHKLVDMHLYTGRFQCAVGNDGKWYLLLPSHDDREPKNAARVSDLVFDKQFPDGKSKTRLV